jgi:hypothetical protein
MESRLLMNKQTGKEISKAGVLIHEMVYQSSAETQNAGKFCACASFNDGAFFVFRF